MLREICATVAQQAQGKLTLFQPVQGQPLDAGEPARHKRLIFRLFPALSGNLRP